MLYLLHNSILVLFLGFVRKNSMKYRNIIKDETKVSVLGFGCMRFPLVEKTEVVDIKEVERMLYYAIDNGINYIDTAWPYHNEKSEEILGFLLKNGYRKKVKLATKMPCWLIENRSDFDKYLDLQMRRLKTEYIDYYLLHALFSKRWESMMNLDVLTWADEAKKKGQIGGFGFSFHDSLPVFKKIIDEYPDWDFCQIQYNMVGEDIQAGTCGLKYANKNGIPIIVMEPLLGGLLAAPPSNIKEIYDEYEINPVELALKWLWNKKEINLVLSGMSSMDQVKQNIDIAARSSVGCLTDKENIAVKKVQQAYLELEIIPCTKCRYCMPCPNKVDIPRILELYNETKKYGGLFQNKVLYTYHVPDIYKASSCTECGECLEKCPQKIDIPRWLSETHKLLLLDS